MKKEITISYNIDQEIPEVEKNVLIKGVEQRIINQINDGLREGEINDVVVPQGLTSYELYELFLKDFLSKKYTHTYTGNWKAKVHIYK
jgi:hypothetical protein